MAQFITKLLAGILLILFLIRLFNNQLEIPSFLYYVVGMFFLLIVSLTYWKDQRIGLSLFVLIVAIMTGFVAVAEIY
ncbi:MULTISPECIES: hypothetical protein [Allobacillus]|uniref:DUF3953 domain-containing protein n=1 Tax=Allobacillus halotolerans TaxID=570278 RepID=A0ABS6GL41_9BACI|nr:MULTISPECIES: hypothetical protein [Allobacillus]MBU6079874.1 hypothetical protein [Allobacillus halotolerans]TSJ67890.1 hypothetical protein FPQ10_04860 [Allobacillus sp. SKP2-8]